jgi:hypothetical protein
VVTWCHNGILKMIGEEQEIQKPYWGKISKLVLKFLEKLLSKIEKRLKIANQMKLL